MRKTHVFAALTIGSYEVSKAKDRTWKRYPADWQDLK